MLEFAPGECAEVAQRGLVGRGGREARAFAGARRHLQVETQFGVQFGFNALAGKEGAGGGPEPGE